MAVFKYLSLAVVLCTYAVTAAPAPAPDPMTLGGSNTRVSRVIQMKTEPVRVPKRNGTRALAKAFKKFNAPMPHALAVAAGTVQGSVTATPEEFDVEYLAPVTIGGQRLMLDFDTGSSDLWVFSTALPAAERSGHSAFNPSASSTFENLSGESFSITFGDGSSARGTVGTDTVEIGGVTATSQAVELATAVSSSFVQDVDTDGLVGLAFDSINSVRPNQQKTFFSTVEPDLAAPVFTADLNHDAPGSYDFGFIDSSKFTGTMGFVTVNTANGFWEFTASGFGVGSTFRSASFDVIADTGTTLLLLPDTIINDYYDQVQGAQFSNSAGGVIFPCSATLPSLSIGVGSFRATIPGSLMNFAPLSATECFGAMQSSDGIGFSVLGDIIFKSNFVVFDGGNTRIGFAAKA